MAVVGGIRSNQFFIGLSTDTKPATADFSATFYEQDTGKTYIWTGNENTTTQATNPIAGITQWIEYLPLWNTNFDPNNPLAPSL